MSAFIATYQSELAAFDSIDPSFGDGIEFRQT
jgi:hypothetical protein